MPQNYEMVDERKRQNPMIGLIGFIMFVLIGGLSYGVSGFVTQWLKTTTVVAGATGIKILPLAFPAELPPIAHQLIVTVALFMILFAITMTVLFMVMRPKSSDEMSVSMDTMRREAALRKKRR